MSGDTSSGSSDGHDDGDRQGWSAVAGEWASLWGDFADPVRHILIAEGRVATGTRVLDVGCGSGEFLRALTEAGAVAVGIDPARGMVDEAKRRAPGAEVRQGGMEDLPWADVSFDVVTAVNALQFADDTLEALGEMIRVAGPGGRIAVANWADRAHNDIDSVEIAVAAADGEDPLPDGDLRVEGGLEELFRDAGLEVLSAGLVELPWEAADDDSLVRGVLLGAPPEERRASAAVVLAAARPFARPEGGYRLLNAFRYVVGRVPD
ncbi:class I SAM-dependent methyltransferase [Herbiconiux ginsengi]|uniref:Methyltransferase domain-containing protein n=1 Tax=Herbiconiux ginsengi TaxID=381665 RepID=A0A1H3Q9T1_9MICO|nr:class I SAM-dependent methyltransferase [Herbiconiux ginsengi]SDZ09785.1 Methyltransferase domain-containing protein [Herbiconiux ginsengi]